MKCVFCVCTCVLAGIIRCNSQAKRQQRKLNFLITQTELYAHFMAKKLTGTARLLYSVASLGRMASSKKSTHKMMQTAWLPVSVLTGFFTFVVRLVCRGEAFSGGHSQQLG